MIRRDSRKKWSWFILNSKDSLKFLHLTVWTFWHSLFIVQCGTLASKRGLSTAAQHKSKLLCTQKLLVQRHMEVGTLVWQDGARGAREKWGDKCDKTTKIRLTGRGKGTQELTGAQTGLGRSQRERENIKTDYSDWHVGHYKEACGSLCGSDRDRWASGLLCSTLHTRSWRNQCKYVLIHSPPEIFLTSRPPGGGKWRLSTPHISSKTTSTSEQSTQIKHARPHWRT